ncbi:isocitrate lyase/phosphoenolpyruvate mutase family protein [Sulfitobacter sp. M57]|uniref:isocitrate lyase/PEP mutase family protein n=1 Tax=unclassified Sulfitobacter TaxID=196795 RepID=UPI0023E1A487|nr:MULTISPECIES: isocitrate lyase/phosphoenolpyruvate mutase family protein [unclassified Sulfitobacter]MDF3413142.1 isocitrate lyase/phosphoenolpyruvate mutase family protein [Sulfitobacter sp. KE5]MDF3421575.1 isocitrate lyase/phosphoenolpyruvate mutase family protein [Sulfitobacter sp. KE43]MDF3431691.1 isocitrate lyase/phosphoenolpyruvate mutase family protein [Sulfitobacter sp. KE42]MDF3457332.1 isocitrate lyase/phosphoenolpyruvate mutase family protein [Sulfitobacter sp. S74]MDF3461234.1
MTGFSEKAAAFRGLHVKGQPLVLHNIWDAGSAKAVAEAGASAVATGSWAVAAAQGFGDGEALPMAEALRVAGQVVDAVTVPVSVDFEGGYALAATEVAVNAVLLREAGAVGMNFEDRVVGGEGLHAIDVQVARVAAVRAAVGPDFFINARTDVFFCGDSAAMADQMAQAVLRAKAYAQAGADGIFVPGLADVVQVAQFCAAQNLPVNVMRMGDAVTIEALAEAGVARVSHGPGPYLAAMQALSATVAE